MNMWRQHEGESVNSRDAAKPLMDLGSSEAHQTGRRVPNLQVLTELIRVSPPENELLKSIFFIGSELMTLMRWSISSISPIKLRK